MLLLFEKSPKSEGIPSEALSLRDLQRHLWFPKRRRPPSLTKPSQWLLWIAGYPPCALRLLWWWESLTPQTPLTAVSKSISPLSSEDRGRKEHCSQGDWTHSAPFPALSRFKLGGSSKPNIGPADALAPNGLKMTWVTFKEASWLPYQYQCTRQKHLVLTLEPYTPSSMVPITLLDADETILEPTFLVPRRFMISDDLAVTNQPESPLLVSTKKLLAPEKSTTYTSVSL